jgi:hypothetical protein
MSTITVEEAKEIGIEAYVFLYPLVLMDLTRRQMTNLPEGQVPMFGPMGKFIHVTAFPPADFKAVVRPNFDTLYSMAWLDVTHEPIILSVPDTHNRYYLMPMADMWTDVFAAPGTRTSGSQAGHFGLVQEDWHGELPAGVERIECPTPLIWIIGRTQTNGVKDYANVHKVQTGYALTPLSQWGKPAQPPAPFVPDASVDMKTPPMHQLHNMTVQAFFARAAELMKQHPPHYTDWSTIARLRRIGIQPGTPFEFEKLDSNVQAALASVPAEAIALIQATVPKVARVVNGWTMNTDTMGVYGDNYLKRAVIAMVGLGANQTSDAIYPLNIADADGNPLNGNNKYVLHFDKAELPPVNAFWSVTLYDSEGFHVANALDRFVIGDRDDLTFNPDGSLDIYVQHEQPAADSISNWLPAPSGPCNITMRLYAPKPQALNGAWNPPAVKKLA